jgi:hypothetical protein
MNRRRIFWSLLVAALAAAGSLVYAQVQNEESFKERWPAAPVQLHPAKPEASKRDSAAKPHSEAKPHSTAKPHSEAKPKSSPRAEAKPLQKLPVSLEQALYLIRSTLLTLNDANRSGNYTVLHDLAAPAFQAKNTPADLARIFSDLRGRHIDLYAAAVIAPQLTAPPHLESNGMLRLTGVFPTRPLRINFDMLFQDVDKQWRLFGISVATPQTPPATAQRGSEKPQAKR